MKPFRKKIPGNLTSPYRAVTNRQKRGLVPKSNRKGTKAEPRLVNEILEAIHDNQAL